MYQTIVSLESLRIFHKENDLPINFNHIGVQLYSLTSLNENSPKTAIHQNAVYFS